MREESVRPVSDVSAGLARAIIICHCNLVGAYLGYMGVAAEGQAHWFGYHSWFLLVRYAIRLGRQKGHLMRERMHVVDTLNAMSSKRVSLTHGGTDADDDATLYRRPI